MRLAPIVALVGCAGLMTMSAGCSRPLALAVAEPQPNVQIGKPIGPVVVVDEEADTLPRVTVRYNTFSPSIDIVAWDAHESAVGLRASVRRDGTVIRDHRVFVSTAYFSDWQFFARANWHVFTNNILRAQPLLFAGRSQDLYPCDAQVGCSPFESLNLFIPDAVLRAGRDAVIVRAWGSEDRLREIVLPRIVVDAYLAKYDAVTSELRATHDR
jgi:hypothetical protein